MPGSYRREAFKLARCRGCGAEIDWVETTKGKRMPVDVKPIVTVVTDTGQVVRGRTPHWQNCPASDEFRGNKQSDVSEKELELLNIIKSVPGYLFDYVTDLEMIRSLAVDFPGVDLKDELKQWQTYKLDQPLTPRSNPRSQIRNWMKKAVEFGRTKKTGGKKDVSGYDRSKFTFSG